MNKKPIVSAVEPISRKGYAYLAGSSSFLEGAAGNVATFAFAAAHFSCCSLRWAGHVARMGEGRDLYRILVGKPKGKRPLERPRRRWEDDIKIGTCDCGSEPSGSIKCGEFLD
jgi:hypothetical protein